MNIFKGFWILWFCCATLSIRNQNWSTKFWYLRVSTVFVCKWVDSFTLLQWFYPFMPNVQWSEANPCCYINHIWRKCPFCIQKGIGKYKKEFLRCSILEYKCWLQQWYIWWFTNCQDNICSNFYRGGARIRIQWC